MLSETVSYNGATLTFKRADVRSRIQASVLYKRVGLSGDSAEEQWYFWTTYVGFLLRTTVEGDLGFTIPSLSASTEELEAGLEAFLAADESLYECVTNALNRLDEAVGEDALAPNPKKEPKP